jgi:hypothetical protein
MLCILDWECVLILMNWTLCHYSILRKLSKCMASLQLWVLSLISSLLSGKHRFLKITTTVTGYKDESLHMLVPIVSSAVNCKMKGFEAK